MPTTSPLRLARVREGLRLFDVRLATGIPETRLSRLERRMVEPRPDEAERLALALRADPHELFPEPVEV